MISGFVDAIVLVSRIVSDRLDIPADEIVRACFARAEGTLQRPE